ncbi:MAG: hypothetical protein LAP61_05685 [Acidobacteriia bacterium]|nr:hypothetical protein [Terriglobia bacterium]
MSFIVNNWYWSISGNASQVWSSAANGLVSVTDATYEAWLASGNNPTPIGSVVKAMAVVIEQKGLLDDSDVTMHRIAEAVALSLNSWTGSDVVAFVDYRRALRAIVSGSDTTSTSIPARPSYPTGT